MAWLGTRLHRRRSLRGEALTNPVSAAPEVQTPTAAAGGLLVVLIPEARATTAFRLHTFTGAEDAAAFIRHWFRPEASSAVIVFWALHERPLMEPGSGEPEAIALVREDEGSDIVFFSSFSDMHSARSLVRAKVERGLDLGQTLVYWAAPVTIDYRKPGVVHLTPATPPPVQGEAVQQLPLVLQERDREPESAGLKEAPAPAHAPPEPSPLAPEDLERTAELTGGDAPEPSPLPPTDFDQTAEVIAEAPEPSVPAFDGFEEAAEPSVPAFDGFDQTAEMTVDAPPEPSTVVPDDDTAEAGAEPVATDAASEEPASDEEEVEVVPTERLVFEVEKVLRVNRWNEREGPFRGFGSPPGKF